MDAGGHAHLLLHLGNHFRGFAQRFSRRQVERDGHYRKLSLVVDGQRGLGRFKVAEGRQRHLRAGGGFHIDAGERTQVLAKLRINLQHHVILVELGKHGGDLALAKSVIERIVNGLRQDSKTRGRIAVNHQVGLQPVVLLIAGYVAQLRKRLQTRHDARGPVIQLVSVSIFQRVLELGAAHAVFYCEVLHRLHVERDALHLADFRLQPADHLRGAGAALVVWLQVDLDAPTVARGVSAINPDER